MRFSDRSHAEEWIIRNQFGRRNLPVYDRVILARRLEEVISKRSRQGARTDLCQKSDKSEPIDTKKEVAKIAGVSHDTVAKVKRIDANVTPEVKDKLSKGQISINEAYQEIKKEQKKAKKQEQKKAAEAVESALPAVIAKQSAAGEWWKLGDHLLYCGDTSSPDFFNQLPRSQLAFADPPYGAGKQGYDDSQFYWHHDYLQDFAKFVVVTPGFVSIFEFARITDMPYKWSIACWISNGMTRGAMGFGNWIYAAVFCDGSVYRNSQDFCQVAITTAENGDTQHTTRKPAAFMAWILEAFTKPGDKVIDPFLGSGQTLIACEATGRKCIGG
jgi:hypothetical protein